MAHARLSINDLTTTGSQPMINDQHNKVIIFNGEIYNHMNIRNTILKNYNINWRGNSDTETLLKSIEYLGLKKTLDHLEGMFSFCFLIKIKKKYF